MKNLLLLFIIFTIISCTTQKSITNTDLIAKEEIKYDPSTMKPRNFDETEIWFDYNHNKPLIDTNKSIELTNL